MVLSRSPFFRWGNRVDRLVLTMTCTRLFLIFWKKTDTQKITLPSLTIKGLAFPLEQPSCPTKMDSLWSLCCFHTLHFLTLISVQATLSPLSSVQVLPSLFCSMMCFLFAYIITPRVIFWDPLVCGFNHSSSTQSWVLCSHTCLTAEHRIDSLSFWDNFIIWISNMPLNYHVILRFPSISVEQSWWSQCLLLNVYIAVCT